MFQHTFDAVVAAVGGDFTTVQAADDYLDSGAYSLYVKNGSYAGFTVSTDNVRIEVEPGTVFTSGITLSGDNIELLLGPGCDLQGLLSASGDNVHIQCENGCDLIGLYATGNNGYFCGGGWDTLVDGSTSNRAIDVEGTDWIVQNVRAQTSTGYLGCIADTTASRTTFRCVQVVTAGNGAILVYGDDSLVEGCITLGSGASSNAVYLAGDRLRLIGNYIVGASGANALGSGASASDCVLVGNIITVGGANKNGVQINGGCEDWVIVGNRISGYSGTGVAVNDTVGSTTEADNDKTA